MIKKAQIRFICITMSILLAVFGVIFGASYFIIKNINNRAIERTLDDVKSGFITMKSDFIFEKSIFALVTPAGKDNYSILSWYDSEQFSKEQVDDIINIALHRPAKSGSIGNVFYDINANGAQFLFVAADMTEQVVLYRTGVLNAFFTLVGIYLLLFLIVWRLSFKVFQPIRDSFYKQKQFISNASHELKTPITIISANADVLKQNGDNQWVSNIKAQTERLDILIADMLTLAKIDEGKEKRTVEEFNLSDEVLENVLPFDAVAFEKGKTINLFIDSDIMYKGDVQDTKKIVNILLDNAVKHATVKGEINVTLKKENGKATLSVFNTGSEIPFHDSNKVFERFYRGDASRSRASGGSGLGLSIAKSIADANKWKIFAVSHPGESMTITVIFI